MLSTDLISKLSDYRSSSFMKKAALNLLVRNLMERTGSDQTAEMAQKLESLRIQFEKIDLDGSGLINASELSQAMIEANIRGVN